MQINNEYPKLSASNLNFYYGPKQVLKNISLSFNKKEITALIGPSGCGKSTFLRTLNRMNDLIEGARLEGSIKFGEEEINHQHCDVVELRRRIGMECYFKSAMSVPMGCRFEKRQRKDMILPAAATVSTFLSRRARRGADGSAKTLPRRWKPLVIKAQLLPGAA